MFAYTNELCATEKDKERRDLMRQRTGGLHWLSRAH